MAIDLKYVAAGLGLVAAALFFSSRSSDKSTRASAPAASVNPNAKTQILAPDDRNRTAAVDLEKMRQAHGLKHMMKIKKLPTKTDGERRVLTVRTALEALWCKSGDFDVLKAVTKDATRKDYALSLEAIDGSRFQQGISLSFADISKGHPVTLSLPRSQEAVAYGLYLCSDPSHKKSCRDKAAMPADIYKSPVDKMPAKLKDRIFYFQYLIVDASGPQLVPSEDWSSARFASLRKAMKGDLGSSDKDLEQARRLLEQIQPIPARVNGNLLEIPLAYNDPRCAD